MLYIFKKPVTFALLLLMMTCSGCGAEEEEFLAGPVREESVTTTLTEPDKTGAAAADPVPTDIYVDVCGAVREPGVVRLPPESRVYQAVEAAGGLLPQAAGAWVNQARMLQDGEQVYVPSLEEVQEDTQPALRTVVPGTAVDKETQSVSSGLVDINSADLAGLMTLTGIGQAKAQAILDYRAGMGPFTGIEDIKKVSGIGEGIFAKIKDHITAG